MADNLSPLSFRHITGKNLLRVVAINAVINTLIAVCLSAIGFGNSFAYNFVFSQCIGMSILAANGAAAPLMMRMTRLSSQIMLIAAAVLLGTVAGTLLGATANGIDLSLFLKEHAGFFGQVLLVGMFFGALVSYAFISLNRINEEKMKRLEAEKSAFAAELQLLQSQMEPHFLFNTLSTVISLIDSDREKAKRMLEALTALLRSSLLKASRQRTTTMSQEMALVKSYLSIFSIRMGDRLRFRIDLPAELDAAELPPLLIQPLVENAIKHGLEPKRDGGEITVSAAATGGLLRITVTDSGVGVREKGAGTGIGLANIKQRLDLAYGGRGRFTFEENAAGGVNATIEIPYEHDTSHTG